ncbi:MAG: hypothetical protein WCO52_02375 [bacterium]
MDAPIVLTCGEACATILPDRGATVTRWMVKGKDIFYPETLSPVCGQLRRRGGMPLLFPQAGEGKGELVNHGFARSLPWQEREVCADRASFTLADTEATRAAYPFSFGLQADIHLFEDALEYVLTVKNTGKVPLPTAPGLHPYLKITNRNKGRIETDIPGFSAGSFTGPHTLFFPWQKQAEIRMPDGGGVQIAADKSFKRLSVWTEPGNDFICFEPWRGEVGALQDPKQVLMVAPSKSLQLRLRLQNLV